MRINSSYENVEVLSVVKNSGERYSDFLCKGKKLFTTIDNTCYINDLEGFFNVYTHFSIYAFEKWGNIRIPIIREIVWVLNTICFVVNMFDFLFVLFKHFVKCRKDEKMVKKGFKYNNNYYNIEYMDLHIQCKL